MDYQIISAMTNLINFEGVVEKNKKKLLNYIDERFKFLATELGMALAQKGHHVHFITYKQPVRLDFISNDIHFHEVYVEKYPLFQFQPYELALSSKMVEVVEMYDLEILHVHYAIPHAYAAYMAKKMLHEKGIDIKVVTTLHGTDITLVGSHPNYKTAVEFSINNSDIVTTV